jgi:hypothetical protein
MAFALREYLPLLAEAVRAAEITWKKDPSQWPRYRITFAKNQQRWVLCERCRLKLHDAKKRDEAEALGSVIRPPNATAAIHENPDLDVQMSKLAEGKLARRLHGFSHRCPFSILALRGEIDL